MAQPTPRPTPTASSAAIQQLTTSLVQSGLPTPHPSFLQPILSSISSTSQRTPPLSSLHATARLRLLASDLTGPNILSPTTPYFPPNTSNVQIPSQTLSTDIPVQVLDIEDLGKSKWEQIEALESERKGETTKGREVIRVIPDSSDNASSLSTPATQTSAAANQASTTNIRSAGPFRLLLQDARGQKAWGFELKKVEKLGMPPYMAIGCKVVLKRGCKVARGMVLLEPATVVVLGGKIEALDKVWREGREGRLRDAVNTGTGDSG
ncbi:Uncharacterized protein BP5553_09188 [Venustampulla echinocandica]|uniref:Uncharacterized protein n=1 Tax=Venustampulla echinocandica TaxID=2656787 RepID=A0A370TC29_9HELO|nr:Uncharacterized protein BP5553_09188 [Venustampulla echinocandica]RDL31786.1 Uncharacterized protein BP5553_09188 [Venustampulla echinocandica]